MSASTPSQTAVGAARGAVLFAGLCLATCAQSAMFDDVPFDARSAPAADEANGPASITLLRYLHQRHRMALTDARDIELGISCLRWREAATVQAPQHKAPQAAGGALYSVAGPVPSVMWRPVAAHGTAALDAVIDRESIEWHSVVPSAARLADGRAAPARAYRVRLEATVLRINGDLSNPAPWPEYAAARPSATPGFARRKTGLNRAGAPQGIASRSLAGFGAALTDRGIACWQYRLTLLHYAVHGSPFELPLATRLPQD